VLRAGACGTGFGLHLNHLHHLAENILFPWAAQSSQYSPMLLDGVIG
jgi:hypothetical protein